MDSRDAACFETSGILTSFKLVSPCYPSGRRNGGGAYPVTRSVPEVITFAGWVAFPSWRTSTFLVVCAFNRGGWPLGHLVLRLQSRHLSVTSDSSRRVSFSHLIQDTCTLSGMASDRGVVSEITWLQPQILGSGRRDSPSVVSDRAE